MITNVMLAAKHCRCEVCGYEWDTLAKEDPRWCANHNCRSREWNGKKNQKITLPKPKKVRALYEHATDPADVEF